MLLSYDQCFLFLLNNIVICSFMRHCKLVHQSQSQNCATFSFHIWFNLWKTNIIFSHKYLGLPVITKYVVKEIACPEEGPNFCYFNLTLVHFYTNNTWNSQKKSFEKLWKLWKLWKAFSQSCMVYGKYLLFET